MSATLETSLKEKIKNSIEIPILTRCCFCFPLRKGLIALAYINLVLTLTVTGFLSLYISIVKDSEVPELVAEYPRLIVDTTALCIEIVMCVVFIVALHKDSEVPELVAEYPRLIVDTTALCIEIVMCVVFIVALHKKHVLLMKIYLYFEIVYSTVGVVYGLAFITRESASELFLILFQLMWQIYLAILIWSSITKMQRDDTVKYVRERDPV